MSITFDPLGRGNCLHNGVVAHLAIEHLNQNWPIPAAALAAYRDLFRIAQQLKPELALEELLPEEGITEIHIKGAMNRVLQHFQLEHGGIDWANYQELMGLAGRTLVAQSIQNNPEIKRQVLEVLHQNLSQALDISTPERINYPDDIQDSAEIRAQINTAVRNQEIPLEVRKESLCAWFTERGLDIWLNGRGGRAIEGTSATETDLKVYSTIFQKPFRYLPAPDSPHYLAVLGFNSIVDGNVPENASIMVLDPISRGHWLIRIAENALNHSICNLYAPQRRAYNNRQHFQQTMRNLRLALQQYGSFQAHARALGLSDPQYCYNHYLTREQYLANRLPDTAQQRPEPQPAVPNPAPADQNPQSILSRAYGAYENSSALEKFAIFIISIYATIAAATLGSSIIAYLGAQATLTFSLAMLGVGASIYFAYPFFASQNSSANPNNEQENSPAPNNTYDPFGVFSRVNGLLFSNGANAEVEQSGPSVDGQPPQPNPDNGEDRPNRPR